MTFVSVLLVASALGLATTKSVFSQDAINQANCPNLEERLVGLMQADDPGAYAFKYDLQFEIDEEEEGWIRVIIEMERVNDKIPIDYLYTVQEETRYGKSVQARSRIPVLCDLSNEPQVEYVRPVIEPIVDDN
jgi:hypothetical protein